MTAKRYYLRELSHIPTSVMDEHNNGNYVSYEDYKQLLKETQELRTAVEFYAHPKNWEVTTDYEGYLVEGIIRWDDLETMEGTKVGGSKARATINQVKKITGAE